MALLWVCLIVGAAVTATAELVLLHRQRRLWLSNHWPLAHLRHQPDGVANQPPPPIQQTFSRAPIIGTVEPALSAEGSMDGTNGDARRTDGAISEPGSVEAAVASDTPGPRKLKCHAARRVLRQVNDDSSASRAIRNHAARSVLYWMTFEEAPEADADAALPRSEPAPDTDLPAESDCVSAPIAPAEDLQAPAADEGVVYVDAGGRFTFANPAARALLHWRGGELALSDVLIGGSQESAAVLNAVARQELIGRPVTVITGPSSELLEMSGLPFRDRDGNLWGAALFIRRASASPLTDTPSAPSRH